ncbi:MAG: DNA mismatch repair protein MutS, partial [Nitratireductor sp.]
MRNRATKGLTEQDRILWERVARTATPLKGRHAPPAEIAAPADAAPQKDQAGAGTRRASVATAPRQ